MSVQKKSLISNLAAAKKAVVASKSIAQPNVSKNALAMHAMKGQNAFAKMPPKATFTKATASKSAVAKTSAKII